ncbi:MAG: ATP-binding protein [Patescibacteria group bacterium]
MNDKLGDALRRIGIRASADAIRTFLSHSVKNRRGPTEVIEGLVALEIHERDARNLARRERCATLGTFAALDSFDWNHPRRIERDKYEFLLSLEFIQSKENVLFRGPSGVGKTMLAQNLGLRAIQNGKTIVFSTLASVLHDLLRQESIPATERRLKRYTSPDVLILDELGYLPCDNRAADLLYNIICRRHEHKATIITTNLPFKQWNTVFPGAACVVALVDRFASRCHTMDIDADSWRQKHPISIPPMSPPQTLKMSPKKSKN